MTTFVSDLPVAALADRLGLPEREAGNLVATLGRLGIGTLQIRDRPAPSRLFANLTPRRFRTNSCQVLVLC